MVQEHYQTGLVIGRFQPFHNGHLYLLKEALKVCDKIIIGIGSSNVINSDNPWSIEERRKILDKVLSEENIADRVLKVVDIPDDPDDNVWFQTVMEKVGSFDVWIGNNDWNEGIFKEHDVRVLTIPFWQRYIHEGTKIRELIREGKPWEDRVPEYLVVQIKNVNI